MQLHHSSPVPKQRGFLRLGCLLWFVAIALIWGGGQGLYTSLSNQELTKITYQEFVAEHPEASWVEVSGGQLNLLDATTRERFGSITELFIPLTAAGEEETNELHILVATKDPELLKLVNEFQDKSETDMMMLVLKNRDKFFSDRPVKGLARFGIEMRDKDRRKLKELDDRLVDNFVVIDENEEPALLSSGLMLAGGLVLLTVMVLGTLGGSGEESSGEQADPSAPASGGTTPPPVN